MYSLLKGSLNYSTLCQEYATKQVPPQLCANLITLLESLTTMPTVASELNTWWCSTPVVIKPTAKVNGNKKRKLSASASTITTDDGATGIFDSSSSEGEYDETTPSLKLNSRDSKKMLPPLLSLPAHRRVFQDAYLALLALPMDEAESKRVLSMLHRQVLPHMTDPRRLMDWLVDCISQGEIRLCLDTCARIDFSSASQVAQSQFWPSMDCSRS